MEHRRELSGTTASWRVGGEEAASRLDRALADHLDLPRNQVQRWIREGLATVNESTAKPSTALVEGDLVTVTPPAERDDDRIEPEEGEIELLHQDEAIIVIDKPAGLTVHPGAGRPTGTLAHRLLAHFPEIAGIGGPGRPGIVHRLDHDTTGVMVIARTPQAYRRLAEDFAQRRVEKLYRAVVYGKPPAEGRIEAAIGRHPQRRTEMAVRPRGRPAVTHFRARGFACGSAQLEIDLETGRTHQIRVHLKHAGYPLVGDPVYGEARWKAAPPLCRPILRRFPRPALHAWKLRLNHPLDGRSVEFEAPLAEDLVELWRQLTAAEAPLGAG